jgi:hypothetical protein
MQTYKLAKYTVSQYTIHDISKYIICIFRDLTIFRIRNTIYDHYCKDIAYLHEGRLPLYKLHDFDHFVIYRIVQVGKYCDICRIINYAYILRVECHKGRTNLYYILYCRKCFDKSYDIEISHKFIEDEYSIYYLAT